jgi:chromosome partitioning protein
MTTYIASAPGGRGGDLVGKTTGAANTAAAHAETGARVLAIDLDPQGQLGELFAIDQHSDRPRLEHVMLRQALARDAIVAASGHLHVLPCSEALAEAQFDVAGDADGHDRLHEVLEPLQDAYDYIVLDSPPGIGF